MIFDAIEKVGHYLPGKQRDQIMNFVNSLSPKIETGYYGITDNTVYARIMSYKTKHSEQCVVEVHGHYIDIQFSLQGAEGIDIFAKDQLRELQEYDVDQDVQIYETTDDSPIASVVNREGYFCLIPAGEPHRPMRAVAEERWVKKCVIKILSTEDI